MLSMKTLILNILLFPVAVLPVVALTALGLEYVFGDLSSAEPGLNPIFWLIYTAPWVAPAIILTPVIHILIWFVFRRSSLVTARLAACILSPVLFSLSMLALWGSKNFTIKFIFPIAIAGLVYGGVFRIAENTNHASKTNST